MPLRGATRECHGTTRERGSGVAWRGWCERRPGAEATGESDDAWTSAAEQRQKPPRFVSTTQLADHPRLLEAPWHLGHACWAPRGTTPFGHAGEGPRRDARVEAQGC